MPEKCPDCGRELAQTGEACPGCSQTTQDMNPGDNRSALRKPPRIGPFTCLFLVSFFGLLLLLGMVIIPRYHGVGESKNFSDCRENLRTIAAALNRYAADNGGQYPESLENLVPGYLASLPECPQVRKNTYSKSYSMTRGTAPATYTFYCSGNNHNRFTGKPDYPRYTSRSGLEPGNQR